MKLYKSYFKIYLFLFLLFIFSIMIINIVHVDFATAASNENGMADVPVGRSTQEPMGRFKIIPNTPMPTNKSSLQDCDEKILTDSDNKKDVFSDKKTPSPIKKNGKVKSKKKIILPSDIIETQNYDNIYLEKNFLNLKYGEQYVMGISFISKEDSDFKTKIKDYDKYIEVKIINCNKLTEKKCDAINSDTDIYNNNDKYNNSEILSVDENYIVANKAGLAVVVYYLKSNPDIKACCTVRILGQKQIGGKID